MAIRKISDLPIIEPNEYNSDNIICSYMELSYEQEPGRYISKKITPKTLLSSVIAEIRQDDNSFTGDNTFNGNTKFINNGPAVEISGGFYVNRGINPSDSNYNSVQNYYDLSVRTANKFTLNVSDKTKISGDNNGLRIDGDITFEKGKITTEASEGTDIVNLNKLSSYVKQKIDELIEGQSGQYLFDFPYLTFVYSDHVIQSDNWKIAGSVISLSEYTNLRNWLFGPENNYEKLRKRPTNGNNNDTFYYQCNENRTELTLPKTKWFIQGNEANTTTSFEEQKLPKPSLKSKYPTGDSIHVSGASTIHRPCRPNYDIEKNIVWNDDNSSNVYQDNADVQPYATRLMMYFYVGKKG